LQEFADVDAPLGAACAIEPLFYELRRHLLSFSRAFALSLSFYSLAGRGRQKKGLDRHPDLHLQSIFCAKEASHAASSAATQNADRCAQYSELGA
jgi:hypothetical protein